MAQERFTEGSWRADPRFRALCAAIAACRGEEEIADFLRDIATLSELQAFGERLEVAKQLARGLSYRQVAASTGASTTTVTRVAKYLEGGEGGYRRYLKRQKFLRQEQSDAGQSPLAQIIERQAERHHEQGHPALSGERPGSALRKFLSR